MNVNNVPNLGSPRKSSSDVIIPNHMDTAHQPLFHNTSLQTDNVNNVGSQRKLSSDATLNLNDTEFLLIFYTKRLIQIKKLITFEALKEERDVRKMIKKLTIDIITQRLNNNDSNRYNYANSEAKELIDNLLKRISTSQYLENFISNNGESIDISRLPERHIYTINSFIITNNDFFVQNGITDSEITNHYELNKEYMFNDTLPSALKDAVNKYASAKDRRIKTLHGIKNFDNYYDAFKQPTITVNYNHDTNPEFDTIMPSLSEEELELICRYETFDDDYPKLEFSKEELNQLNSPRFRTERTIYRLENEIEYGVEKVLKYASLDVEINDMTLRMSRERYFESQISIIDNDNVYELYDGRFMVHDRYYDREQILQLCLAIKEKDEKLFVDTMVKIISGFPKYSGEALRFKETFIHLFVTGNFQSNGMKLRYHHLLGQSGYIHGKE